MPTRVLSIDPALLNDIVNGSLIHAVEMVGEKPRDIRVIDARWAFLAGEKPVLQLLVESEWFEPWIESGQVKGRWEAPAWMPEFRRLKAKARTEET